MHGYTNRALEATNTASVKTGAPMGVAWLYRQTQALPAVYVLSRPRWQHIHLPSAAEGAPSPAQHPERSLPLCALAAKRFSEVPVLRVGQPCSRWSHPRPPLCSPKPPVLPSHRRLWHRPVNRAQRHLGRARRWWETPGAPPELGGRAGWGPGGSSGDPAASNRPHVRLEKNHVDGQRLG